MGDDTYIGLETRLGRVGIHRNDQLMDVMRESHQKRKSNRETEGTQRKPAPRRISEQPITHVTFCDRLGDILFSLDTSAPVGEGREGLGDTT